MASRSSVPVHALGLDFNATGAATTRRYCLPSVASQISAAWVRLLTCSFCSSMYNWLHTLPSPIPSCSAIKLLVSPAAS